MAKKTWLRGDRLRDLRKEREWSQEELADILHLSNQQHVSKWESGSNDPSAEMLIRIAQLFDVTVDYLLGLTAERKGVAEIRQYPDLKELLAQAVDHGDAAELLEFIASRLKRKE